MTEYLTATGSRYLVDHEHMRVRPPDGEWIDVVHVAADGRLVFIEIIIPGDPPVSLLTTTSLIVGVRDVVQN